MPPTFYQNKFDSTKGFGVIDWASACGASSPGFNSRDIQMFFSHLMYKGIRKCKEPAMIKDLKDLVSPNRKKRAPCHLGPNVELEQGMGI